MSFSASNEFSARQKRIDDLMRQKQGFVWVNNEAERWAQQAQTTIAEEQSVKALALAEIMSG